MRNDKGTTLLEMLIALALFGLISAGLVTVYWISETAFNGQSARADVQYSARHAREAIISDFVACTSFSVLDVCGGIEVADGSVGTCLHIAKSDRTVDYYINNQQLYRNPSNASPGPVAEFISQISFSKVSLNTMAMSVVALSQKQEYTLETTCCSRIR
ncbi:MAG: prepilin-type N-terminal cleavage/methylation domain-containing protein [Bacillota bacterium]|nr:prepilin-type N-terminal cleavage/methylation domain-containing protein [Bacillota bacterium]